MGVFEFYFNLVDLYVKKAKEVYCEKCEESQRSIL
jgi:hypothetical protein